MMTARDLLYSTMIFSALYSNHHNELTALGATQKLNPTYTNIIFFFLSFTPVQLIDEIPPAPPNPMKKPFSVDG